MKANIAIFGDIDTGKSYSLRTLLRQYPDKNGKLQDGAGLNVHFIANEPGWAATNGDLTCEMGFHVAEVLPANPSFEDHQQWLERIQDMDVEQIKKLTLPASIRQNYRQFLSLFETCIDFRCIRCKESFGAAEDWGEDIALVNDGLTGISKMAVDFTVGPKPALSWPEFDAAQRHIERYIDICVALNCTYILVAHWAREPSQVEGGTTITVHTVGQKLAGRLILDTFDEIILSQRTDNKWTWNMNDDRTSQKARRLPRQSGLVPDFRQIFATNKR